MRAYKCIFFDLDHTLWDYDSNSRHTLLELYERFNLASRGVHDFELFNDAFKEVNTRLWEAYDRGQIESTVIREERFKQILECFELCDDELCETLSSEYLTTCPLRGQLMPYATDVLNYLAGNYRLTVITNGFEEIQRTKLASGKMTHYFDHVITSQRAGHKKPAREIFEYALQCNNIKSHEAVMVGDNLITDIGGAKNASIDAAFYNPLSIRHDERIPYEIRCLSELRALL